MHNQGLEVASPRQLDSRDGTQEKGPPVGRGQTKPDQDFVRTPRRCRPSAFFTNGQALAANRFPSPGYCPSASACHLKWSSTKLCMKK